MASTSSEEGPNLATLYNVQPQGSDESDMPDWIIQSHTPLKTGATYISSDDGSDEAGPSSKADRAGPSSAAAADDAPGTSQQQPQATPSGKSADAKASSSAAAAAGARALAPAAGRSAVQLILPEKLIRNKVLLELEPAPHQATELSGDAGAVGRLVVSSLAAEGDCFKVDLKGVLYQATVLPLSGTALVVNMGPTEAKVESVLNDFVRLREESSYHDMGVTVEGGSGMAELMADDEDVYQLGDDAKEGGEKAAKKAAKPRSKAGTSKAAAGSKALKPAKAGVKKKQTKSKPAGKGGKGAGGAKAKATPKKTKAAPKAKPAATAKPKAASATKKTKKKHSDSDDEDDWDSDWSGE